MNPIKHVAIIMDGNGRWGVKHKQSRNAGHRAGLNTVDLIINHCINHKIKFLTLYTFSSENWKRPKNEIVFLFKLLENFLQKKINEIIKKDIKLKFIGELNKLPTKLQKLIKLTEKKTFDKKTLQVNIALNYGSKIELINTIKKIKQKKITINEKNIDNNLYTKHLPNPDILIRTGNTHRLSNFLLWQLSYTEIFFEKKLWPDFNGKDFNKIIDNHLFFTQYTVKTFKNISPDINIDELEKAGEVLMYRKAWDYIKSIDLNKNFHVECLKNKASRDFVYNLQISIQFFELHEEYEKCALLKNIETTVEGFLK